MKYIAILVCFCYLATASAEGGDDELSYIDKTTIILKDNQPLVVHCPDKSIKVNANKMTVNGPILVTLENDRDCRKWIPNSADRINGDVVADKHPLPLVDFQTPVIGYLILVVENDNIFIISNGE